MPVLVFIKEENMTIKCETLRAKDGHRSGAEEQRRRQTSGQPVLRDSMPPLCGEKNGCLTGRKI